MAGAPTGPTLRGSRHRRRSGAGHLSGHLAQARFLSSTGRGGGLDLGGGHPPVDRPAQAPVRPGTGPARVSVPEPSAGPRDAWLSSSPLDEARVFSIEAHLIACDVCRTALSPQANPERLERMWSEVVEAVDSPRPGPVERILRALGVKDHLARL